MNIEDAKRTAPRLANSTESQCIVGKPDDCEVVIIYGFRGFGALKGKPLLSQRSYEVMSFSKNYQGNWIDHQDSSKEELNANDRYL